MWPQRNFVSFVSFVRFAVDDVLQQHANLIKGSPPRIANCTLYSYRITSPLTPSSICTTFGLVRYSLQPFVQLLLKIFYRSFLICPGMQLNSLSIFLIGLFNIFVCI